MLPQAVKQLKEDFKGDNADAREADLFRGDYENRIVEARKRLAFAPRDEELLLKLAEAHGVLDPQDARCLDILEELIALGAGRLPDLQRQGDFWHLYGRSLFLADRFEESLLAFLRAKDCYRERGNKALRRRTNTGLLRVYAALGKSKLAAERLEVALTLCEDHDEMILLYMHAKHALEQTGVERDASVLDDIWYVELDTNDELRRKFESYNSMVKDLVGSQMRNGDDRDSLTWEEVRRQLRRAALDLSQDKRVQTFFAVVACLLFVNIVMLLALRTRQ